MGKKKTYKKKIVSFKEKKALETVDIHYLKTKNYRTYHVDGIFGGITPDGKKLYIELFVQRSATPRRIKYEVKKGVVGKETGEREGKEGIVREIESGLIMDIEVAKVLKDWMDRKIKPYEKSNKK